MFPFINMDIFFMWLIWLASNIKITRSSVVSIYIRVNVNQQDVEFTEQ